MSRKSSGLEKGQSQPYSEKFFALAGNGRLFVCGITREHFSPTFAIRGVAES